MIASDSGFEIQLDARSVMTPHKSKLAVPTIALAERIAEEWRAVEGVIKPANMPMTKRANSAIERIAHQRSEIEAHLCDYVMTDLICYRAASPKELVERQCVWDEWLVWAEKFGLKLHTTIGVMPISQDETNRMHAKAWLSQWNTFEFVGVYDFITLTGSFVLGMTIAEKILQPKQAFELSQIDEKYQESVWGIDEDALELALHKQGELVTSHRFFETVCR